MKQRLALIGYGILGALLVWTFAPLAVWSVQTYVIPGTPTPRAELVTNIPNRDEALRSSFSGTSAPSSPSPVAGQWWFDSTGGVNYPKYYDGASWWGVASLTRAETLSNKVIASPTITGSATASVGSAFTASAACASGFKRIGAWCIASSSDNPPHYLQDVTNGAVNDTTVNWSTLNNAKAALLGVLCMVQEDGTGNSGQTKLHVREATSGDQTPGFYQCFAGTAATNETVRDTAEIMVPLDASGDFEYETTVTGTVTGRNIEIWLMGYID